MIDKVKSHISRHKVAYSLGSGIAFAGITCFIMRGRYADFLRSSDTAAKSTKTVFVRPLAFFSNQNVKMQTITVFAKEGRGHPGYPVMCKETGDIFLSQGGAAAWAGVTDANMSQHLSGRFPDVYGLHFERIPAIPAVAA